MIPEDLARHGPAIRDRWEELILEAYPEGGGGFFRNERDPFRNPVGATVRNATTRLLEGLCSGEDSPESAEALDRMVRLRCVQNFSPGEAAGFPLLLKRAVAETLGAACVDANREWLGQFHSRIDGLVLRSIDAYVACREQIQEIRNRDVVAQTYSLLRRAGALETPNEAGGPATGGRRRRTRLRGDREA